MADESPYGLDLIRTMAAYRATLEHNPANRLLAIDTVEPSIRLSIAYASPANFTGTVLYDRPAAFLRAPAAEALRAAQQAFRQLGLGIKVFDAYRPYSVTARLWECVQDARYVAEPWVGSRHNRGCAVDLSLVALATGRDLAMPSDYDDFSEKAHHGYGNVSEEVRANRRLLKTVMEQHRFRSFATEWWHYDFDGWDDYALLDLPFQPLLGEG